MNLNEENYKIVWISIDPLRKHVDFYPKAIAAKIENAYSKRDKSMPCSCVLGSDFFNATVHFHHSGSLYQTTPGTFIGRGNFKQPGHRSVKRIPLRDNHTPDSEYIIYSKYIHGELRIALTQDESEKTFTETIPHDKIIYSNTLSIVPIITSWEPEDLDSNVLDKQVVVWQWCRGTPEKNGNIIALGKEWWIPYLYEQNKSIEYEYIQNSIETNIVIAHDNSIKTIKFTPNSCYAIQKDSTGKKIRQVRRIIVSIQELTEMLNRMNTPIIDYNMFNDMSNDIDIPNEFYCCISQDIMRDPVKTIDNFTYDRSSIERWFQSSSKSPLTGLILSSRKLVANNEIKNEIDKFLNEFLTKFNSLNILPNVK